MDKKRGFRRRAGDAIGAVDDSVQGFIREKVYGLPEDGSRAEGQPFRNFMGQVFHGSRAGNPGKTAYRVEDSNEGKFAVGASRSAQAGAVTAAGLGLMELTKAIGSFGGPADQPEPNQLPM